MRRSLALLGLLILVGCSAVKHTVSGTVQDEFGPVAGAVVRLQSTNYHTTTDDSGSFSLSGIPSSEEVFVTAWYSGYFIAGVRAEAGDTQLVIQLHHHADKDNPAYTWLPSQHHPGQGEDQGCAACHSSTGTEDPVPLPVDEWLLDAHSQSASNPRFISMYLGSDVSGNLSPPTRYASSRDYGSFPLPPDLDQPYYGPGYKLDFPETAGNCAACHTPAASVNDPYGIDPTEVDGVAAEGVPCDFCHKIWDVRLNPVTDLPYANMPGVLSYEFRRPPEGHQFFAGPYDDVAPGEDTFSPLQQESAFCAPCHFGVFWDTTIYNSYGEWLESPYSDPDSGKTCQECHMPPGLADHFALEEVGGLKRDPETIFSHKMPGAADVTLLRDALTMTVSAELESNEFQVQVELFNDNTGHHIPTDSPLRHMILVVQAYDRKGNLLDQTAGPMIADWAGVGDPVDGYYGGLPGTIYAKVLEELWTKVSPSGAYWNPTQILSDNRIPAMESDTTEYRFAAPDDGTVRVEVQLIFRRAFIELIDQKGWDAPDILIAQQTIEVNP